MNVCKPCPVCGHQPRWHPSQIRPAESIGCNWDDYCPQEGSFDFSTPYLPDDEAVAMWNAEVDKYLAAKDAPLPQPPEVTP